jgi:DNA-binding IscR family transcriptional regulator
MAMILTRRSDYGLRAVLALARSPHMLSAKQIAQEQHLPVAFVKKLLQRALPRGLGEGYRWEARRLRARASS